MRIFNLLDSLGHEGDGILWESTFGLRGEDAKLYVTEGDYERGVVGDIPLSLREVEMRPGPEGGFGAVSREDSILVQGLPDGSLELVLHHGFLGGSRYGDDAVTYVRAKPLTEAGAALCGKIEAAHRRACDRCGLTVATRHVRALDDVTWHLEEAAEPLFAKTPSPSANARFAVTRLPVVDRLRGEATDALRQARAAYPQAMAEETAGLPLGPAISRVIALQKVLDSADGTYVRKVACERVPGLMAAPDGPKAPAAGATRAPETPHVTPVAGPGAPDSPDF